MAKMMPRELGADRERFGREINAKDSDCKHHNCRKAGVAATMSHPGDA
jgi:hypothetical protein